MEPENKDVMGKSLIPPRPIPPRPPRMNIENIQDTENQNLFNPRDNEHNFIASDQEKHDQRLEEQANEEVKLKKTRKKLGKKFWIIFSSIIMGILLITGVVFGLYFYIKAGKKIDLPNDATVQVISMDDKAYLYFDIIDGAEKYIFYLEADGEQYFMESSKNIVNVSGYVNQPKTFKLSVCVEGKTERSRSKKSPVLEYNFTKKLKTPVINLNRTGQNIIFEHIDNATSYTIIYFEYDATEQLRVLKSKDYAVTGTSATLSLSLLDLDSGTHSLYVVAKSNSVFYSQSDLSNSVLITVTKPTPQPLNAQINGNIFRVELGTLCDQIEIDVNNYKFLYDIDQTSTQTFAYDIDLTNFNLPLSTIYSASACAIKDGIKSNSLEAEIEAG